MIRHTTDPAQRAANVSDREAEEVWRATGHYGKWSKAWFETYRATLNEFQQPERKGERSENIQRASCGNA